MIGLQRLALRGFFRSAIHDVGAGRPEDLGEWLRGAIINRDRDLRLKYLAGMGMNLFENDRIYADMLRYRRFPENLFAGSEARMQALWEAGGGSRAADPRP